MEHKMFCYQCQETAGCSGCTQMGVCGKKAGSSSYAGSARLCEQGIIRGHNPAAQRRNKGFRRNQPLDHLESVYHHHKCQLRQ